MGCLLFYTYMEGTLKLLRVLGIVLVLVGLGVVPAFAEPAAPPGSWVTDFTVLNLESAPATVQIKPVRPVHWGLHT